MFMIFRNGVLQFTHLICHNILLLIYLTGIIVNKKYQFIIEYKYIQIKNSVKNKNIESNKYKIFIFSSYRAD